MDEGLCRQTYGDIVDLCARLAAYGTSSFPDLIGHGHYESRAKELATRDIIFLAISVRRMAELTKSYALLKGKSIPRFTAHRRDKRLEIEEADESFDAWMVVGNIIHAKTIKILKDDADFVITLGRRPENTIESYNLLMNRHNLNGIVIIESDRGEYSFFEIYKFIKVIVDFTDDIDDLLADNKIYVGEGFA
jgi:hypothetical protein